MIDSTHWCHGLGPFRNDLYDSENFLVDFSGKSVLSGGIIL
jgi:hypothetical protein